MDSVQSQHTAQMQRRTARAFVLRFTSPLALSLALALPCIAQAVSIGDIVLQSHLGEPLKARVSLSLASNETVDEGCLTLIAPSAEQGNPDEFITQASLSLQQDKDRSVVLIQGNQPINKAYVRLQLQVRCPGQGSISRTFTALPSLESSPSAETPAEPSLIQSPTLGTAIPIKTRSAAKDTAPSSPKARRSKRVKTNQTAQAKDDRSAPISRKAPEIGEFHLRLSTDVIDTSRVGKLSEADRNKLLAQQRLLDQDDQTANFLALQHQVMQLQEELKLVRVQMGQAVSEPAQATSMESAQPAAQSQPAAVPTAKPTPVKATTPPPVIEPESDLMSNLALALGAILLILVGLRQYNKRMKAQWTGESIVQDSDEPTLPLAPANLTPVAVSQDVAPVTSSAEVVVTPAAVVAPEPIIAVAPPVKPAEPPQESDWVVEEAELYAVHGHPELAIQILEKLLDQSPDKPQAWLLLLSILSSLDRHEEFESAARRFAATDSNRTYWKEVQALGQRIDKDNPLYFGEISEVHEPVPLHKPNHRPLGAILLDTGALTEEVLMGVLAQFNPKRDGRIGAFLIQHGLISNEQLETALQIQRVERAAESA
ncbi:hypothetical protein OYT1_ch2109 [Ferriphaselus amnicola]|uniref:FimV N-terminal domain-containing protein n=1 Tax=Ferriphaselus amnicola TaxID=1188319 RepID=A0A2Z6GED3_9PROT|nr:hypothetical protein [Ferriphaselus amnicola]BBE51634.1 hypothetical protein OYT1_ch2109 [Ferriphaselus amnicola]